MISVALLTYRPKMKAELEPAGPVVSVIPVPQYGAQHVKLGALLPSFDDGMFDECVQIKERRI